MAGLDNTRAPPVFCQPPHPETSMTASHRKFAGTLLMLGFLAIYAVVALAIAAILQVNAGRVAEWIFYVVAGLAWVPGAAWIVSWMHRSDPK